MSHTVSIKVYRDYESRLTLGSECVKRCWKELSNKSLTMKQFEEMMVAMSIFSDNYFANLETYNSL